MRKKASAVFFYIMAGILFLVALTYGIRFFTGIKTTGTVAKYEEKYVSGYKTSGNKAYYEVHYSVGEDRFRIKEKYSSLTAGIMGIQEGKDVIVSYSRNDPAKACTLHNVIISAIIFLVAIGFSFMPIMFEKINSRVFPPKSANEE
ncbi:MAG: hypothetical protein K5988_10360 [Lachnospiraceae bacterium]|nr:hypothetical protein [Lachnospiraceae bacterium]